MTHRFGLRAPPATTVDEKRQAKVGDAAEEEEPAPAGAMDRFFSARRRQQEQRAAGTGFECLRNCLEIWLVSITYAHRAACTVDALKLVPPSF